MLARIFTKIPAAYTLQLGVGEGPRAKQSCDLVGEATALLLSSSVVPVYGVCEIIGSVIS